MGGEICLFTDIFVNIFILYSAEHRHLNDYRILIFEHNTLLGHLYVKGVNLMLKYGN